MLYSESGPEGAEQEALGAAFDVARFHRVEKSEGFFAARSREFGVGWAETRSGEAHQGREISAWPCGGPRRFASFGPPYASQKAQHQKAQPWVRRDFTDFPALKGRNSKPEGAVLGSPGLQRFARPEAAQGLCSALSGRQVLGRARVPRAAPWAFLFGPFRADARSFCPRGCPTDLITVPDPFTSARRLIFFWGRLARIV